MPLGDTQHVRPRDPFHGLLVLEDEVLGVVEVSVANGSIQRLDGAVEAEDERVQHAVLGVLELLLGDFLGAHLLSSALIAWIVSVVVIDLVEPKMRNVPGWS